MQNEAQGLERLIAFGKRRGRILAIGAAAAVLIGCIAALMYYNSSVLSYAKLAEAPTIERSPTDADRFMINFRPSSRGRIGFRKDVENHETELLDYVTDNDEVQQFRWQTKGLKKGDIVKMTYRVGLSTTTAELEVPEQPEEQLGRATLAAEIVDAQSGAPIEGALVHIVSTQLSATTDSLGKCRLTEAPSGLAAIEIMKEGYSTVQAEETLVDDQETSMRKAISRGMKEGQMRVVLTWDDPSRAPADLDAHMTGPLPEAKQFSVSYHDKGDLDSKKYVQLDIDDRDGEGPETITVRAILPGTYKYYVHNYDNRSGTMNNALAKSGATVTVYQGGQVYSFKSNHESAGNIWKVFEVDVNKDGSHVKKIDEYVTKGIQSVKEDLGINLYSKRTAVKSDDWIMEQGGSVESEAAVKRGLGWLHRHQHPDGYFANRTMGTHKNSMCIRGSACSVPGYEKIEMAHTGLSLLAFLGAGHYPFNGNTYSDVVRKGLDWMVGHQKPNGLLTGSRGGKGLHHDYMYEHGMAAFALAEAVAVAKASGQVPDSNYLAAAKDAIAFIENNQHTDGGWRYTGNKGAPSDASVSGWQVLALKTAMEAGIPVDAKTIAKAKDFFTSLENQVTGRGNYHGGSFHTEATTGINMLVKQFLHKEPDHPYIKAAAPRLAAFAEKQWGSKNQGKNNYYTWYNNQLAMFQAGGEEWERWNNVVREKIIGLQSHKLLKNKEEACEYGSWSPNAKYADKGGRIYSTALGVLTLEAYYRYAKQRELNAAPGTRTTTTVIKTTGAPKPKITIIKRQRKKKTKKTSN